MQVGEIGIYFLSRAWYGHELAALRAIQLSSERRVRWILNFCWQDGQTMLIGMGKVYSILSPDNSSPLQ